MSTKKTNKKDSAKKTSAASKAKAPAPAKAVEQASPVPVSAAAVLPQGEVYFSRDELSQLEIAQLRAKTARQDVDLADANLKSFVSDAQARIKAMQDDIASKQSAFQKSAEAVQVLYLKFESKYGFKMNEIAYNAESGRVNFLPKPSAPPEAG